MSRKFEHGVFYPNIKLICPDGDGLLWATEEMLFQVHGEMLADRGHELTEAHYRQMVGLGAIEAAKVAIDLFGLKDEPEQYRLERIERARIKLPTVELMPGVPQAFETFKRTGAPTALVSAGTDEHVATIIDAHKIRQRFLALVTADTPGNLALKPDPALYAYAVRKFDVKAMYAVSFEDTVAGVTAARNAGLVTVAVPHRFSPREALAKVAHYVIPEGQTIGDFDFRSIQHFLPQ